MAQVFRDTGRIRVCQLGWLLQAVAGAFAVTFVAYGSSTGYRWLILVIMLPGTLFGGAMAARAGRVGLWADGDRLTVRNWYRTRKLARSDVASVGLIEMPIGAVLALVLRDGSPVRVDGVGAFRPERLGPVGRRIEEVILRPAPEDTGQLAAAAATSGPGPDATTRPPSSTTA